MTTNSITTLSEFLAHSGAKYRVFDLGRRVVKLSSDEFSEFELAKIPYSYPFQQKAFVGIIFWNPTLPDKHYVWFLTFPLDEQGILIQAARDEFLVMLLDRVGECMLSASDGKQIEGALKDSPYTFKPREDKMAAFNAQATKALAAKPSHYYEDALAYFTGQKDINDWHTIGMQGVADIAVRLEQPEHVLALSNIITILPDEPFQVLCTFLEHSEPPVGIVEKLAEKLESELQQESSNISQVCACLRAVSNSSAQGLVDQMVMQVLQHPCSLNIEVLAIISGRIWRTLEQQTLCQLFVEQLAHNDAGQQGFSHLLADVMFMPGIREYIMRALRSANRSERLSQAVGEMFS